MKSFYIFLFFLTTPYHLFSQYTISLQWQKSYGGTAFDHLQSAAKTIDGGYILAGYSASIDGDITSNNGERDFWIVKIDSTGNMQWQKCYGGSARDEANSVKQTSDGGYIVAGFSYSTDGDLTGNYGGSDYWVIKLNSSGNLEWQNNFGGNSYDNATDIIQTFDGGYLSIGNSNSNNGMVTGNHGSSDVWVIKLTPSGSLQWQKSFGGSFGENAYAVEQTATGDFIIAASASSLDGDVSINHGGVDFWLLKLTSNGVLIWEKSYGGSNSESPANLAITSDGGYILAGSTNSNNGDISNAFGNYDYWIVKTDSAGNLLWEKSLGGTYMERARSIKQTMDDGYIVCGFTHSMDGHITGNHGVSDIWLTKLDDLGNLQWQKCLGGSLIDIGSGIFELSNSEYLVTGSSESIDEDITNNIGYYDFWIAKLSVITNIHYNNTEENIIVRPNPFNEELIINIPIIKSVTNVIELIDNHGKIILRKEHTGGELLLNTQILKNGMYYLKILAGNSIIVKKIIKY